LILKIIIWTIITTIWVAGSIGCGLIGMFYVSNVDKGNNSESEVTQCLKLAAAWWTGCVAIVASMIGIVWLAS